MAKRAPEPVELTYPLGTVARLTGLSPDLLRAWERRYGVVEPLRSPGGTRRYRAADLERLRLVKAVVDAGHRISDVARLDVEELERRAAETTDAAPGRLDEILDALDRLDGAEAQRLLSIQLAALGPVHFAHDLARPLLTEIGERWANGELCIASEHMASAVLRTLLGSALQPSATSLLGPRVVFATPSGEDHELGLQIAALTAMGAGANPLYLGASLPVEQMLIAVERSGAAALVMSFVTLRPKDAQHAVREAAGGLDEDVAFWVGGSRADELELPAGVERLASFEELEQRVALLCSRRARNP
ncbi:MAG: MerR family transcriptional regulator [Myxococcota bacterium]|nr:MerR family transcriptional regulator [Myxococcota bacterium]